MIINNIIVWQWVCPAYISRIFREIRISASGTLYKRCVIGMRDKYQWNRDV